MTLSTLTPTNLRRFNSAIYAIKELVQAHKIDEYEFIIDTLLTSYYGIAEIATEIELIQREEQIKRHQEYLKKQK